MLRFIKINATIVSSSVKISVETETDRHRHQMSLVSVTRTPSWGEVCVKGGGEALRFDVRGSVQWSF